MTHLNIRAADAHLQTAIAAFSSAPVDFAAGCDALEQAEVPLRQAIGDLLNPTAISTPDIEAALATIEGHLGAQGAPAAGTLRNIVQGLPGAQRNDPRLVAAMTVIQDGVSHLTVQVTMLQTRDELATRTTERDTAITERDAARTDLATRTTERDTAITERDAARTDLATRTTERDTAITERDAARTDLATRTTERDTAITERDQARSQLNARTPVPRSFGGVGGALALVFGALILCLLFGGVGLLGGYAIWHDSGSSSSSPTKVVQKPAAGTNTQIKANRAAVTRTATKQQGYTCPGGTVQACEQQTAMQVFTDGASLSPPVTWAEAVTASRGKCKCP